MRVTRASAALVVAASRRATCVSFIDVLPGVLWLRSHVSWPYITRNTPRIACPYVGERFILQRLIRLFAAFFMVILIGSAVVCRVGKGVGRACQRGRPFVRRAHRGQCVMHQC